ncbi:MAG: polymorphic toxin-type HINT domain-containing protein [Leptospiraceae bacterium]|nr:polymorphic toxin-type HINT domain-containing protein [Leptospiraceae bacterium]
MEEIKVGDKVLSWDETSGKKSFKKVVNTFVRQTDMIYRLKVGKDILETTWNHPFYVKGRGFVQAKDLKVGDMLTNSSDEIVSLEEITIEDRDETVYNFEVEDNHTYYVGESGVLVHMCQFLK